MLKFNKKKFVNTKIEKIINDSYQNGTSKIIVVTGKGLHSQNEKDPYVSKDLSILKYSVPDFIEKNKSKFNSDKLNLANKLKK